MDSRAGENARVLVSVTIAAPREDVWEALRHPEQLRNWFGWEAETLDDEIAFIFLEHAQADPARYILQFDEFEGMSERFELIAAGQSTVLRVLREGTTPAGGEALYDDMVEGWISFVQQLRLLLERHRGEVRRTVYLSGKAAGAGVPLPIAALGLGPFRDVAPGESHSVRLATGDQLSGALWHRSHHQVGIGVDAFGDGLLIVTDRPPGGTAPFGGGSIMLTTFGLHPEAFADLEQRFTAWWRAAFP